MPTLGRDHARRRMRRTSGYTMHLAGVDATLPRHLGVVAMRPSAASTRQRFLVAAVSVER